MDLDLWNMDFQLAPEWALDTGVKITGQSGDLPVLSCQDGDGNAFSLQLTTELQPESDTLREESNCSDDIAIDWMETGDVGNLLESLGDSQPFSQPQMLPMEQSVLDLSPDDSCPPALSLWGITGGDGSPTSDCVVQYEPQAHITEDVPSVTFSKQQSTVELSAASPELNVTSPDYSYEEVIVVDTELSPPPTPKTEQQEENILDTLSTSSNDFEHTEFLDFGIDVEDFTFSELDLTSLVECTESSVQPVIDSSLATVNNVESTISFLGPSSSDLNTVKDSSFIKASPELFKVISTTSPAKQLIPLVDLEAPKLVTKSPRYKPSKRKPVKEIPEYVILQELDKKGRKKLQNKNAAIRYRMKKKEEAENEKNVLSELESYNASLKTQAEELGMKINVMKTLMKDMGILV